MKKRITLFAVLILCINFCVKSQTFDTTTYSGKVGYIFNNVNTSGSLIPSGFLRDYGVDFLNLDNYSGSIIHDSNFVSIDEFRFLYASLYSAQINSNAQLISLDTLNRLFTTYSQATQPVSFSCLYFTYQSLVPNAITSNLMSAANGQLYDVAGRTQSPYANNDLFAVAPVRQAIFVGSSQLLFPSSLFFGNTGKILSGIQIDPLGTGSYQSISLNTPLTVSYNTAGFYNVNIKISYTDGTIKYSHTKLAVYQTSTGSAFNKSKFSNSPNRSGLAASLPNFKKINPLIYGHNYPYYPITKTATKAYMNIYATGDITIDLATSNTTGQIRKPLIIIEGFDPVNPGLSPPGGNLTYVEDFLNRMSFDFNYGYPDYYSHPIPLNSSSGLDDINNYDIIYLHFANATDYIQRNAYLLEKVITDINNQKTTYNGVRQQNVILGMSMGGLVVRYALRDMELNSLVHDTRLFISHDAPYWGANIPPATQAAVQQLGPLKLIGVSGSARFPYFNIYWKDLIPSAVDGLNLLNSPAAKQMIIQNYILSGQTLTADNSIHTSFMNEINGMGWPVNCKIITLSNGACNGTKIYPDNSAIAQISGNRGLSYVGTLWRSFLLSIGGILTPTTILTGGPGNPQPNAWALFWQFPLSLFSSKSSINIDFRINSVPASSIAEIYRGDIYSSRKILGIFNVNTYFIKAHVNSTTDMIPLDNAPGGEYSLTQFGFDPTTLQSNLPDFFANYVHTTIVQQNFCFVPTVSSLAISNPQQNLLTNLCNTVNCLNPPQVTNYYAPQQNQFHISYTTDNSNWILQQQDPTYTCTKICPTSLAINGDNSFCTTSNVYTINSLPNGVPVTWSASPANTVQVNSPNNNQTSLTLVNGGIIALNASLSNVCGPTSPIIITKPNIIVGYGSLQFNYIDAYVSQYLSGGKRPQIHVDVTTVPAATQYDWYLNNVLKSSTSVPSVDLIGTTCNTNYTIKVIAETPCGNINTTPVSDNYYAPCQSSLNFIVSPNPASTIVTITNNTSVGTDNLMTPGINTVNKANTSVAVAEKSSINQVTIYDASGKVRKSLNYATTEQSKQVQIGDLENGIYFIEIKNGLISEKQKLLIFKK